MNEIVSDEYIRQQLKSFDITDVTIAELNKQFLSLTITGPEDREGYKVVQHARKTVKTLRIKVDHRRKELTADAIKFQRAINEEAKRITGLLEPIEAHLLDKEESFEAEKERLKKEREESEVTLIKKRAYLLCSTGFLFDGEHYNSNVSSIKFSLSDLKYLDEEDFSNLFLPAEQAYKSYQAQKESEELARKAALEKAEAERQAEIKRLEAIAKEKSDLETAALKAEQEKIAQQRKEQEDEKRKLDAIAKEQAEKEVSIKAEQERLESEKFKQAQQEKLKARAIEDEKQKLLQEAAENQRRESLKTDKEKIEQLLEKLNDFSLPSVESDEAKDIIKGVIVRLQETISYLNSQLKYI